MKTLLMTICIISMAVLLNFDGKDANREGKIANEKCFGFTVIEAGKGLNCKGDTVRLIKNSGYYQLHAGL